MTRNRFKPCGLEGKPQDLLPHLRLAIGTKVKFLVPLRDLGVIDGLGSQSAR